MISKKSVEAPEDNLITSFFGSAFKTSQVDKHVQKEDKAHRQPEVQFPQPT